MRKRKSFVRDVILEAEKADERLQVRVVEVEHCEQWSARHRYP